jgi:hypothetical protein
MSAVVFVDAQDFPNSQCPSEDLYLDKIIANRFLFCGLSCAPASLSGASLQRWLSVRWYHDDPPGPAPPEISCQDLIAAFLLSKTSMTLAAQRPRTYHLMLVPRPKKAAKIYYCCIAAKEGAARSRRAYHLMLVPRSKSCQDIMSLHCCQRPRGTIPPFIPPDVRSSTKSAAKT